MNEATLWVTMSDGCGEYLHVYLAENNTYTILHDMPYDATIAVLTGTLVDTMKELNAKMAEGFVCDSNDLERLSAVYLPFEKMFSDLYPWWVPGLIAEEV